MIKEHNVTGLKYLCKHEGTEESCFKYNGSGVRWKRHIKKHGVNISTKILYKSNNIDDFRNRCIEYSNRYNVVESKQWANLAPETGNGGNLGDSVRLKAACTYRKRLSNTGFTEKEKAKHLRQKSLAPWNKGLKTPANVKEKISESCKGKKRSQETRNKISQSRKGKKHTEESKRRMSEIRKDTQKGIKNNNWRGVWVTPIGEFKLLKEASEKIKITSVTLSKLCKNNTKPLTKHNIKGCSYFKNINAKVGDTPEELGFSFKYKQGGN